MILSWMYQNFVLFIYTLLILALFSITFATKTIMKTVERYITLAASLCSMFAFVIIIFEKTNYTSLPIGKIIFTILFCIYAIFFTSTAIYGFQKLYLFIKKFENTLLKISLFSFFTFFIVALYAGAISIGWGILTQIDFWLYTEKESKPISTPYRDALLSALLFGIDLWFTL